MASISAVTLSPWLSSRGRRAQTPSACLTFLTGFKTTTSLHVKVASSLNPRSGVLHFSFLHSPSLGFPSSVPGLSLGLDLNSNVGIGRANRCGLVVRAGKPAFCLTKRNRSRKSLFSNSWFPKVNEND